MMTRMRAFRPGIEFCEDRIALSTAAATAADTGTVTGARSIPNIVYTTVGGQPEHLDLYVPTGTPPAGGWPAILALPGGGWRWVRRSDLGDTVSGLTKYGYAVAVADYLYAGTTPGTKVWPDNFDDVREAVLWLKANASKFDINPSAIAAWGESAGGHLANLLGTFPQGPNAGGQNASPGSTTSANVQAVVDFYGPTDLTALYNEAPKDRAFLETFLGGSPSQDPTDYQSASPIDHVAHGDPPYLIFQGTADTANPPAQSTAFDQALQNAGVPVTYVPLPGVPHGFRLKLAHGKVNLLPQVLSFLHSSLHTGSTSNSSTPTTS